MRCGDTILTWQLRWCRLCCTTAALPVPVLSPRLSSHWLRLVSGTDMSIARELVEGLSDDLVASQPSLFEHLGLTPLAFEEAARRALSEHEPTWRGRVAEGLATRVALSA